MTAVGIKTRVIGAPIDRLDGPDKVKGSAPYAFEQSVDRPAYLYPLQATIVTGRIAGVDGGAATAEPGVLALLTHANALKLAVSDGLELAILQSDEVAYCGQFVGGVVAETSEIARHAASLVRLEYEERAHDVVLRPDGPDLFAPESLADGSEPDTVRGDVDAALASAAVTLDATYTTAMCHNNPMEPHATVAIWTDGGLTLYCASQGVHWIRAYLAPVLGLDAERIRVISRYVGGGFGSKVYLHADLILAVMAARLVAGRPVKLALTRQQMFFQVGYRPPTIQRIRLAADGGRLTAIAHDVVEQTSKVKVVGVFPGLEGQHYAEPAAVPTRTMYAAPNRRTTHRVAALDVPPPTIMRGPGETPGMYALESAMDEMAIACGLDPIELRIRNEPDVDPESGHPFSSRNLVACLREGAQRFGWAPRDPRPRARRIGPWLVGTGVAASTFPTWRLPGSAANIRIDPGGRYVVSIGAADMGTGARTALTQIAADALGVALGDVELRIGDTALPTASSAGASAGISSWGSAIFEAARKLRARLDAAGPGLMQSAGLEVTAEMPSNPHAARFSMHAFGAQFAEVRVREDTGEVRVPRILGVFDAGRIINPKTARSQLLGGLTMGISMALHEDSVLDPRFGQVANHDFAEYHIATNADAGAIEVYWLDGEDPYTNPMGSKGIGEIGMVGTAAAIANAVHHATGIRVRDLPITLDKLLR